MRRPNTLTFPDRIFTHKLSFPKIEHGVTQADIDAAVRRAYEIGQREGARRVMQGLRRGVENGLALGKTRVR